MKNIVYKTLIVLAMLLSLQCNKEKTSAPTDLQEQLLPEENSQKVPRPDHIVVVIEENHAYEQLIGSDSAPYINSLIADPFTATFTNSYGIAYGSQPNYLALFSGSNQGVNSGKHPPNEPFTTPNLAKQLIDSGYSY